MYDYFSFQNFCTTYISFMQLNYLPGGCNLHFKTRKLLRGRKEKLKLPAPHSRRRTAEAPAVERPPQAPTAHYTPTSYNQPLRSSSPGTHFCTFRSDPVFIQKALPALPAHLIWTC